MSYTASKASIGLGTQVSIKFPISGSFIPIYEITDIAQSGKTNKTVDLTNLNSSGEEFLAVILSPGKISLTMNRVSSDPGQTAILGAFNAKSTCPWQIVLPFAPGQTTTGDTYTFSGLVDELEDLGALKPTSQQVTKAGIMVSGSYTLVEGA